jgi:hypothetical protein
MKAEHRKELQTNSLADFLGRTVYKVRSGGGGGFSWFKATLVLIVVAGVLIFFWRRSAIARNEAEAWAKIEFNDLKSLEELFQESNKQGAVAKFTLAYRLLWDTVNNVGKPGFGSRQLVDTMNKDGRGLIPFLGALAEEMKDQPERAAEAKYHIMTCYETLAAAEPAFLIKSKSSLEELSKGELGDTAYGMMAKKRLDQYNNPVEFAAIENYYKELRKRMDMPGK